MVSVQQFREWLRTYRYTGPAYYGLQTTAWTVESADIDRWIADCDQHPRNVQEMLDQGSCSTCIEAAAYLKYLEQAARMYSAYY